MSKEHAYAYEAGYRDGSIHYELEHCPACKNIADLQEALEENAKLLRELEAEHALAETLGHMHERAKDEADKLRDENAKLREERREYQTTIDSLVDECADHKAENAKLQELFNETLIRLVAASEAAGGGFMDARYCELLESHGIEAIEVGE